MAISGPTSIPAQLRLVATPGPATAGGDETPVVLFAVESRADAVRLGPVVAALELLDAFAPAVVLTGRRRGHRAVERVAHAVGLGIVHHRLSITGETDAAVTAETLLRFDELLGDLVPEVVVLTGDSDGTVACALAAAKRRIAVAHVDSGLRSDDWSTAEEVNRVVIDRLSDILFTQSREAADNLVAEGVPEGRVTAVGSTVIDAVRRVDAEVAAGTSWVPRGLNRGAYVLAVITGRADRHRPERREELLGSLAELAAAAPVLCLMETEAGDGWSSRALHGRDFVDVGPLGITSYSDLLSLQAGAGAIITDCSAVQEETTALGVPCYSFGSFSERPLTLTHGTNVLLGDDLGALADIRLVEAPPVACAIPLWDGRAGQRIAEDLVANYAVQVSGPSLSLR